MLSTNAYFLDSALEENHHIQRKYHIQKILKPSNLNDHDSLDGTLFPTREWINRTDS